MKCCAVTTSFKNTINSIAMYRDYHQKRNQVSEQNNSTTMEFSNPDWGNVAMTTKDLLYEIEDRPYQDRDPNAELTVQDFMKQKWEREQMKLKEQMLIEDVDDWSRHHITPENAEQYPFRKPLQYVGGVDISFVKGDNVNACAAFVVLNFPELEVVHEDLSMVKLTAPYIAGFLAFREVDFLVEKIQRLKDTNPDILPQVILVDGNGTLHHREFGLACHLGVLTNIPTVGAAKNLLCIDGMERDEEFHEKIKKLEKAGDFFPLIGISGTQHGIAYRSCDETTNPVFLSPGHKISMETAKWVTEQCIKYRVPEPTRQADILSREYLRQNWNPETHKAKKQKPRKEIHVPQCNISEEERDKLKEYRSNRLNSSSDEEDMDGLNGLFD